MKINIAYPANGSNITIKADMHAIQRLSGLKIFDTFDGKLIDENLYSGHIFQITGGNDKEGFAMHKSVLSDKRKKIILKPGDTGYKKNSNKGIRKRKSVRGSVVAGNLAMLNVVLTGTEVKGPEIDTLTNKVNEYTHYPKRVTKWAKKLNVDKSVLNPQLIQKVVRGISKETGLKHSKTVKVTRFVSPKSIKNKEQRKIKSQLKKQKSESQKNEFLAKNPNYGIRQC